MTYQPNCKDLFDTDHFADRRENFSTRVPFIIIDPTVGVLIQGINDMRDNTNLTPMR